MDPSTTLLAPRVAAVPRAQRTFSALAPLIRMKEVSAAVTRVLTAMKIYVPYPSRVTVVPNAKLIALPER
jgi:hypothetical protein